MSVSKLNVPRSPSAIREFDEAARGLLKRLGQRSSSAAVARVIGCDPNVFRAYVRGDHALPVGRLAEWVYRWHAAGYPYITLEVGAQGWIARVPLGAVAVEERADG